MQCNFTIEHHCKQTNRLTKQWTCKCFVYQTCMPMSICCHFHWTPHFIYAHNHFHIIFNLLAVATVPVAATVLFLFLHILFYFINKLLFNFKISTPREPSTRFHRNGFFRYFITFLNAIFFFFAFAFARRNFFLQQHFVPPSSDWYAAVVYMWLHTM